MCINVYTSCQRNINLLRCLLFDHPWFNFVLRKYVMYLLMYLMQLSRTAVLHFYSQNFYLGDSELFLFTYDKL